MRSPQTQRMIAVAFLFAAVLSAAGDETQSASCQPNDLIDVAAATHVARQHLLRYDTAGTSALAGIHVLRDASAETVLAYCFDLQPRGYVVVSGATSLLPVVAYSFTSDAGCDADSDNPLIQLLQRDLQLRLDYAALLPAAIAAEQRHLWAIYLESAPAAPRDRLFQQWPPPGSTPTGGWVVTNWTQSAPYNNLCPLDASNGQHSLAGCPAVAMAQILHYHRRLNGTRFTDADDYYHNYGSNRFWIDNDYASRGFPSWPQLNTHLDTLFSNYFHGTEPSNTSKAALVYACGAAAHQVYSASGSGTFSVAQAMDAFERFGCTTAVLLDANTPNLQARLSQNMMDAHPAHLAVVDAGWTVGHNLVLDGYNTDGYYHMNFGWGGSYNGWYQLLSGLPYSLTVIEGVVADIMIADCVPLDADCDGVIGQRDFALLTGCLAGPTPMYSAPGCRAFDADADGDVDLRDFGDFQTAFNPAS